MFRIVVLHAVSQIAGTACRTSLELFNYSRPNLPGTNVTYVGYKKPCGLLNLLKFNEFAKFRTEEDLKSKTIQNHGEIRDDPDNLDNINF